MKKLITICLLIAFTFSIVSCASMGEKEQQGTTTGAVVGAVAGGVIGAMTGSKNQREKVVLGAAVGAALGGLAGNRIGAYMDQQERALQTAMASSIAANQASILRANEDMLIATFKSDVFFDFNSSILKPGAYYELDRVANVLNQYPQTNVQIQGHTDRSGTEQYNMQLSQRRADAVRNYLIQRQVHPSRLMSMGLGESQAISSNPSQNRRVTIVLTPIRA